MYSAYFSAPTAGPEYREQQYAKGLAMAREGATIHIARTGVWSAKYPDIVTESTGRVITRDVGSYEKLGYHADTDALYSGWIDGGATIIDHRREVRGA